MPQILHNSHPDDELIENYAMGALEDEDTAAMEQHLLLCEACQERVTEADAQVAGMRAAARELRLQQYQQALERLLGIAERGYAQAQHDLALLYFAGKGVTPDFSAAAHWFRRAAEQGHAQAQLQLGSLYEKALGVAQDDAVAGAWYLKSGEQGCAEAQLRLGKMCDAGRGVKRNAQEAVRWYEMAAAQGMAVAQLELGMMYLKGAGVPQNYLRAHMWFNLAGAQGDEDAIRMRDVTARRMTFDQIGKAQEMAAAWKEKRS